VKRFKWLRSVNKSYDEQAFIFYTCATYGTQKKTAQNRIRRLCERAAGEYAAALLEFLTTKADFRYICTKHSISDSTLERARRKFYDLW